MQTPYKEPEKVLLLFKHTRSASFLIGRPILGQKAREIALPMGFDNFSVSNGWLRRFKKRHGLVSRAAQVRVPMSIDVCTDWQQGGCKRERERELAEENTAGDEKLKLFGRLSQNTHAVSKVFETFLLHMLMQKHERP